MENDVISFKKSGILDDPSKKMVTGHPCTQVFEIAEKLSCSFYIPEFAPSLLTFNIYFKYIRETCIRSWYLLPLILLISLQSSAISQKLNFFGLVLNTEGKTLTSAQLILIFGIS